MVVVGGGVCEVVMRGSETREPSWLDLLHRRWVGGWPPLPSSYPLPHANPHCSMD